MKIPVTERNALIGVSCLAVLLAGVSIYEYQHPRHTVNTPFAKTTSAITAANKSAVLAKPTIQTETTLPVGTIAPATVNANLQQYAGKQIKVRGILSTTSDNKYAIVDQKGDKPTALIVDTSSPSVNFSAYALHAPAPGQAQTVKPVTVTGVLSSPSPTPGAPHATVAIVLHVTSIEQ